MFDNVLHGSNVPKRSWGSGTIGAVIVYVLVAGLAVWASARPAVVHHQDVMVKFVKPPPPPPPPPPAPAESRPKPLPKKIPQHARVLQQAIIAPTEIPTAKPTESEVLKGDLAKDVGAYGDVGNVAGGIRGSVIDARDAPIEFNESMGRPEYLSGPSPQYSQKALEAGVQGMMVVKCVVDTSGHVTNCRVVKSLPYMDKEVISALERRRYKPATVKGKPVTVDYTFRINLALPQ